jgi:DNA-binding response OmpR family regulator
VSGSGAESPERARFRILLVDDDPSTARLVQQILHAHGFAAATHVTSGLAALAAAAETDVVVLDHQLPDVSGLEVLEALRGRAQPPSVVLVTAHGNESLAAKALRQGADDYLAKDSAFAELLPQVLERVRRNRALRDALAAAERDLVQAERLAAVAELTVTLHHEINNPLMAGSAEVELLLRGAPDPREALEAIKISLDRIRDILRRIRDLRETQSTDYLAGIRMLDLRAGGGVRDVDRGTAVLALPEDLARVATLLLRTAGFAVVRAATPQELDQAARSPQVTLVLVAAAGGAPAADPLAGFRPAPGRRYRLVALATGEASAAAAENSDHVMMLPFDPGTFVAEILAVLEGT